MNAKNDSIKHKKIGKTNPPKNVYFDLIERIL